MHLVMVHVQPTKHNFPFKSTPQHPLNTCLCLSLTVLPPPMKCLWITLCPVPLYYLETNRAEPTSGHWSNLLKSVLYSILSLQCLIFHRKIVRYGKKWATILAKKSNIKPSKSISGEAHERGYHVFLSAWLQKTFGKADTSYVSSP